MHWRFVWVGILVGLFHLLFILYLGGLLVGLEICFGEDGVLAGTEVWLCMRLGWIGWVEDIVQLGIWLCWRFKWVSNLGGLG